MSAQGVIEACICLAIGILAGLGIYTFVYARGFSYMSNDPKACVNCHIMREEYDSWVKSSHHQAAKCNDCHIPHGFLRKYFEKARNGWNHSKAFTLQNFPEPIRISKRNAKILQENCLHCHGDMMSHWVDETGEGKTSHQCMDCHRSVGHMSLS